MDLREFYFLESSDDEMDEVFNEDVRDLKESAQYNEVGEVLDGQDQDGTERAKDESDMEDDAPAHAQLDKMAATVQISSVHLSFRRHVINVAALAVYAYAGLKDEFALAAQLPVVGCSALGALLIVAVVRATTSSAAVDGIPNSSQSPLVEPSSTVHVKKTTRRRTMKRC